MQLAQYSYSSCVKKGLLHWQLDCLELRKFSFTLIHVHIDLELGVKALLVNDGKGIGSSPG
jgi:hypothetical protein